MLAGSGAPGMVDGAGAGASFDTPTGLAAMADGSVIVADTGNDAAAAHRAGWRGHDDLVARCVGPRQPAVAATGRRRRIAGPALRDRCARAGGGTGARRRAPRARGRTSGVCQRPRHGGVDARALRHRGGRDGRVVVADTLNGLVRVLDLPDRLGPWTPTPPWLAPGFDLARFARVPLVWPLDPQDGPHEVAGTLGEPRGNPGGDGRERFHAGVDVRADIGSAVRAVRDGTISSVLPTGSFGTLNEFLTVGPITYVHIRVGRDKEDAPVASWATVLADPVTGKPARVRVRRGTYVSAGEIDWHGESVPACAPERRPAGRGGQCTAASVCPAWSTRCRR